MTTTRQKVESAIKQLAAAAQARAMYGTSHNLTRSAVTQLYEKIKEALADVGEMTIGIIGDEAAFEKEPFIETSRAIGGFISDLKELKIEKMTFLKGVSEKELSDFVAMLGMKPKSVEEAGGPEKALEKAGVRNVLLGKIGYAKPEEGGTDDINRIANDNFRDGADFLAKTVDDLANDKPIDVNAARFLVTRIVDNLLKNRYSLLILTSIKSHDEYTFIHSINVAIFTIAQAESLGLKESALADIGLAALLHDTGKLAVSGDIIRKRGGLDREEIGKMRTHPLDGAKTLLKTPDLNPLVAITSFEHHIQYNMKGYPQKLFGEKLNLASMLITISDVYDALRSRRAYHEEMAPEKTYEEMMRLSGENFHPGLLENFFRVIGMYPPGTLVELDDKAIGLVVKESAIDIKRPLVEILYNSRGEKEKEPYIINLMEKDPRTSDYKWTIAKSLAMSGKYEIPGKYT